MSWLQGFWGTRAIQYYWNFRNQTQKEIENKTIRNERHWCVPVAWQCSPTYVFQGRTAHRPLQRIVVAHLVIEDFLTLDFHLFGPMKARLRGVPFLEKVKTQNAATQWLCRWCKDFFRGIVYFLPSRWQKCIDVNWKFIEEWNGYSCWCVSIFFYIPPLAFYLKMVWETYQAPVYIPSSAIWTRLSDLCVECSAQNKRRLVSLLIYVGWARREGRERKNRLKRR